MKNLWVVIFCIFSINGFSQRYESEPRVFSFEALSISTFDFPKLDHQFLLEEDKRANLRKDVAERFAIGYPLNINLKQSDHYVGSFEGYNHWMVQINMENALAIGLIFDMFYLPEKAFMNLYRNGLENVYGTVTQRNNNTANKLAVAPVPGSTLLIHYAEPVASVVQGRIGLQQVNHVYRSFFKTEKGFGDSGDCNIDVACEADEDWQLATRAVGLILNGNGTRWCTGTLINTTKNDETPYFLTANHCLEDTDDDPAIWSFIFNYKSGSCDPSQNGPLSDNIFGAEVKAKNTANDFALLELSDSIPDEFNAYFAGWTQASSGFNSAVGIHHPSGDVMKISYDFDPPSLTGYLGGGGDDFWEVADWDEGTTEGGSSGSALFSDNQLIIGQLRGGYAACTNDDADYYGAFFQAWNGSSNLNRLRDWLDPEGLNPISWPGYDPSDTNGVDPEPEPIKKPVMYPNPVERYLTIELPEPHFVKDLEFISPNGSRAYFYTVNQQVNSLFNIPVDHMTNGFYTVRLTTNRQTFIFKLVVLKQD